jgi:hypothetical protein
MSRLVNLGEHERDGPIYMARALTISPISPRCIAVKSSVPQGMFVCFDKEVGWCVGIAVILVCREGATRRSRWIERLRCCWEEES